MPLIFDDTCVLSGRAHARGGEVVRRNVLTMYRQERSHYFFFFLCILRSSLVDLVLASVIKAEMYSPEQADAAFCERNSRNRLQKCAAQPTLLMLVRQIVWKPQLPTERLIVDIS
jgi:hypothetical protein